MTSLDVFLRDTRRAMRHLPAVARSYLGAGAVEGDLREQVMVGVSTMNDCRYCVSIHGALADLEGVSRDEQNALAQIHLEAMSALEERPRLAVAYARRLVSGADIDDLKPSLRERFTGEELEEIEAFAHIIHLSNEAGLTLDAFLNRLKGEPDPASTLPDELGVLLLLSPIAFPFLGLYTLSRAYLRLGV